MTPRHPVRAAIGAACMALAVIAIFGNEWFYEHVVLKADGRLAARLVNVVGTFRWPTSHLGNDVTLVVALYVAVAVVVVGVFFLVWAVAVRATGLALFIGAWGATTVVAMFAGFVRTMISYGELFPNTSDPDHLGRFWFSVFNGVQFPALFGFAVGLVTALAGTLLAGTAAQPVAPVLWQPAPAGGGYGGVSLSQVPAYGGTDATVDPTTPYVNPYPSVPAPTSAAGPYPYTSEYEAVPPPPPGDEQADPTVAMPASVDGNADERAGTGDPTTVIPVIPASSASPDIPEHVEWAPPPPSAASPSWSRPEDPTRHD